MQTGRLRQCLLVYGVPVFAAACGFAIGVALLHTRDSDIDRLQEQGQRFVTLALSVAQPPHEREVDAYFGPASLDMRRQAPAPPPPLSVVLRDARKLQAELELSAASTASSLRGRHLHAQVRGLIALLSGMLAPRAPAFEDEARDLYAVDLSVFDAEAAQAAARSLDAMLPGPGSIAQRVEAFQRRFVVPQDRRKVVFERALAECRARTLAHWNLPAQERLTIEWTRQVDAAWHRYDGEYRSTLQINPQAVAFIGTALDVACHEGYPGHHAQFVMMEADAGTGGLPVEDMVVLLRSPASVLREGAANYGVDLAFPTEARRAFQQSVLFPLAGLNPADASEYVDVEALVGQMSRAIVPILRDYRDGRLPVGRAAERLEAEALVSSPQALLSFVDRFGAYAVGYTVARDAVRKVVETRGRRERVDAWQALREVTDAPQGGVLLASSAPTADFRERVELP